MSNSNTASYNLPTEEWDFREVPNNIVHTVFYYEYSRESNKIKAMVKHCRDKEKENSVINQDNKSESEIFPPEDPFWTLAQYLAPLNSFPEYSYKHSIKSIHNNPFNPGISFFIPFKNGWYLWDHYKSGLDKDAYSYIWSQQNATKIPGEVEGDSEVCLCKHNDDSTDNTPEIYYVNNIEDDPIDTPHLKLISIALNWRLTDKEMKEQFEDFLKRARPSQYDVFASIKSVQTNMFPEAGLNKFPFRKKNALEWLGVLRRKHTGITWDGFMNKWVINFKPSERTIQEQYRMAKIILKWFEGDKFDEEPFKP